MPRRFASEGGYYNNEFKSQFNGNFKRTNLKIRHYNGNVKTVE